MKWKITRNFIFTIVFVVISVVIINIISILYVVSTDSFFKVVDSGNCLLYTSPSPRDRQKSRMPSSA
ncbi:two-component sensor histidine kinase [Clostridium difficile 630] [Clostridioides difficile]|nr:two-component sensor histidine kinase [Clostridium difficile 630] [Clostridioides difficile]